MKDNSTILSVVAVVAVVVVGLAIGKATSSTPIDDTQNPGTKVAGTAVLQVDEPSYDFGNVSMAKGNVSRLFTLVNTSSSTVAINKIFTSCMCTKANLTIDTMRYGPFGMPGHGAGLAISANLAPGESATVEAVFDPAAHGPAGVGPISRSIYLEGNGSRLAELVFKAMVTP
ncbi:MAG: hypothetical protein COV10_04475 [Candidatus Vogelbacteria bacterium CG10_big_fil_rev_8_21_14_0_10_51_16]|uniref:DUF1573 domain-containing protein n=1 Tax=Candidatus Vogelbacteria bacterium CG10_big_fil_rev_8_21_14_0_10_51_16 TaxID=1975045 RepID=A0A2H0RD62_9BACT|nr:MAG: hypothetical protein COV10_04475 [Candidatus Vogelbacteria bacterium CG10_big_fil_rev_8_21_14_0_10_51_16]